MARQNLLEVMRRNIQKYRILAFVFCLFLLPVLPIYAQEDDEADSKRHPHIDSALAFSPDYMPVERAKLSELMITPLVFNPIDTSVVHIHRYDPMLSTENMYQNLGIFGQAHNAIKFDYDHEIGFSYITLPYPLYFKRQSDLCFYDLKTSYTKLAYTYGIPTENTVNAIHAQKLNGATFVFNIDGRANEGYYTHQSIANVVGDFLVHYEIPSGIYGFRASYIYNRFRLQENAGLLNSDDFRENVSTQLAGYNLNLYNATSKINAHDVLFQQYVNILTPSKLNASETKHWGTLVHTFQFKALKSIYFDHDLDSLYYDNTFYYSADTTNDSIHYYSVINSLQWSTFRPYQRESTKKYMIHAAGGIRHEYVESFPKGRLNVTNRYFGNTFTLFANLYSRLFSVVDIQASLAYSFADYNKNDAIAKIKADFYIKRESRHYLGLQADFFRVAPDYVYSYYNGNNYQWDTSWSKQNILKLSAYWNYGRYRASFNYFMLDKYMVLGEDYFPQLIEKPVSLIQLNVFAPFRYKGFGFDFNGSLQYSDNVNIQVPVFAGKLAVFYVFHFFSEKMRLQIGTDLAYNTAYYACGYFPVLRQFYCQHSEKTGNYLYFDAYLNMRIKRVGFFFRFGHPLAGVMGYNYFTTPRYPAQGRSYSIGINWVFYD